QWVDPSAIRQLSVRFVAITRVGDEVRCQAEVTDLFTQDGERRMALALTARNQADEVKLTGTAVVALDRIPA
ncbi:MAG TPA: dehydratase, partial [Aquabacterium sp.]|nr:dehydratase [Aquabacterium sp.]